jgi:hypothetical protein
MSKSTAALLSFLFCLLFGAFLGYAVAEKWAFELCVLIFILMLIWGDLFAARISRGAKDE